MYLVKLPDWYCQAWGFRTPGYGTAEPCLQPEEWLVWPLENREKKLTFLDRLSIADLELVGVLT